MRDVPAAGRDAHDGGLRGGQRRRRPDVRRRGAGRERGQAGPAVRRPGRQAAGEAAGGDRPGARGRVHRQRAQVPPARQPRPAPARDRGLPGLPVAADRPDRAARDLHAGELLDQAPARRPDRDHAPARAAPRCGIIGPRAVRLYPIYHPAAALYTPSMLDTLRADFARIPACSPSPRRTSPSRCRRSSPRSCRSPRPRPRPRPSGCARPTSSGCSEPRYLMPAARTFGPIASARAIAPDSGRTSTVKWSMSPSSSVWM